MTAPQRKIIHIDADCFYAAIEMRDDPTLRDRPLAVGGSADHRGVISTCNYQAREFGVRSAMPSATAQRLCPDLLIVPGRFDAYREASAAMRDIFYDYTELVEPLSLDEAFLDVSECQACKGSATLIAEEIRQRVRETLQITVSAGVAPNKFIAKVASDWDKPDGIHVVTPAEVDDFVTRLPVKRIFGVGKVTGTKMQELGINTCGDLQAFSVFELVERFGSFGARLYDLARGIDHRAVNPDQRRKSLSVESTYTDDLTSVGQCQQHLQSLIEELLQRLAGVDDDYLVTKAYVKMRFDDFSRTTVERTIETTAGLEGLLQELCSEAFQRKSLPVRLLGTGVRFIDLRDAADADQLALFDQNQK